MPEDLQSLDKKQLAQRASAVFAKELVKLKPLTRRIVMAYFENPSLTQRELAVQFKCSESGISRMLRATRIVQLFKALGRERLERLVPQSVDVFARLVSPASVQKDPGEARKAAETVLRESKVIGMPELIVINRFENMSHSDLRRFLGDASALPEPAIDAELVQDDPPTGGEGAK